MPHFAKELNGGIVLFLRSCPRLLEAQTDACSRAPRIRLAINTERALREQKDNPMSAKGRRF